MNIFTSLLLSLLIQAFFFTFAAFFKSDKVTDLTYGLTFFIMSSYLYLTQSTQTKFHLILFIITSIWAFRLASYLFIRILKIKRDKRFDTIRENFLKFASFWLLQGFTVWVVMLPSIVAFQIEIVKFPNYISLSGLLIWLTGIIIETLADYQKFVFKSDPENKGKWIESSLWKHARHPNYFGEMLCWWGIFVYIFPMLSGVQLLSIIGPLFITFMLLFVSGVPTLEKRYEKRYKGIKEYTYYKKNTNLLIPIPIKIF